jgi:hypothetical protein
MFLFTKKATESWQSDGFTPITPSMFYKMNVADRHAVIKVGH